MTADTAGRTTALVELLEVEHTEEEVWIVYEASELYAWGWGYTAEAARALALARVSELDADDPPQAGELTAQEFVSAMKLMRVCLQHRHALDLLAMVGLTGAPGQPEVELGGNVYPLSPR
jgi:hypothetical protein